MQIGVDFDSQAVILYAGDRMRRATKRALFYKCTALAKAARLEEQEDTI